MNFENLSQDELDKINKVSPDSTEKILRIIRERDYLKMKIDSILDSDKTSLLTYLGLLGREH